MLNGAYRYEVTGVFHQIAVGSQRIVRDQVITFATALVLVVVLIGLAFRSLTIMCVALVPNLLPLLVSAAVMAAMAIDLSTGTAMIASVAIGLAVDDTIHYLARFRRERRGGRASADAIRATTVGTGRVLTMTSIVLAMGFWVGVLGSFTPTIYFSLFSGLTMLGALVCDLLVLPACLTLLGVRIDRWAARTA
jgi:predicted RND superfamily exporter protein